MTAEEIRIDLRRESGIYRATHGGVSCAGDSPALSAVCMVLIELSAQIAEMNEHLKVIAHPPEIIVTSDLS